MSLSIDDFATFFKELWGYDPFPWQERLARSVHRDGRWPSALDLPTGTGKTSALDVAVFTLALEDPRFRRLPLRTVLVVDRRTIVDQASLRMKQLADKLHAPSGPTVAKVRDSLKRLAGEHASRPLVASTLRGAMPRDDEWARTPTQPVLVASTVDQVGSRLLFRGYGVGRGSRSIHAGLLGHDALFLLDEVHLARPFCQTLDAVGRYRTWGSNSLCHERWQKVELSATRDPGADDEPFVLESADREHPVLAQRLSASKPVRLEQVDASGSENKKRAKLTDAIIDAVKGRIAESPQSVVGIIHNRVDGAVRTWRKLRTQCERDDIPLRLVTGRMRGLDRTDLESELKTIAGSDRPRPSGGGIVVATQCIEAGADLDFDYLVTECASFDAIVQRMGRLNRRGEAESPQGLILIRSDHAEPKQPDPIYGDSLAATWAFLAGQSELDFALDRLPSASPPELEKLLPPRKQAPTLLPAHLDLWAQTNPEPHPEPDVALFLHGPESGPPDVNVVWRSDLSRSVLDQHEDVALARVEAAPPGTTEAISIPRYAVVRWLQGDRASAMADVEGVSFGDEDADAEGPCAPVLLWRGRDSGVVARCSEILPGDTLVVPCAYGGLEGGTFSPADGPADARDGEPVSGDLGDRVQLEQRGRPTLRLSLDVLESAAPDIEWPMPPSAFTDEATDPAASDEDRVRQWLVEVRSVHERLPSWLRETLDQLSRRNNLRLLRTHEPDGDDDVREERLVARARTRVRWDGTAEVSTEEEDRASFTGVAVALSDHLDGVAEFVRRYVEALALPKPVADAMVLAARSHDLGKADLRFQAMLRGGDRILAEGSARLLAKSDQLTPPSKAEQALIRQRAELPKGWRHELLSVAMLEGHALLETVGEHADVLLHLVGSHHGWCRPLAPVVDEPATHPVAVAHDGQQFAASPDHGLPRLDSGVSRRFWRLNERYGWHGLAWLEAILRLADHRRSEAEQKGEVDG